MTDSTDMDQKRRNVLYSRLSTYRTNPSAIQREAIQHVRDVSNGEINPIDPNSPFVSLMEVAAVGTSISVVEQRALSRKLYANHSLSFEDLYLHMSDKDYIGRFATPSKAQINFVLRLDELEASMVEDTITGNKKVSIPRGSIVTVSGRQYTLMYPVDIIKPKHGAIRILYDGTVKDSLMSLTTNVVPYRIRDLKKHIDFTLDFLQVSIMTREIKPTKSSSIKQDYSFDDQFCYAKIFLLASNGSWVEIQTTHTPEVYDPLTPTAVLKVYGSMLDVYIPQIYTNTFNMDATIRVDIYATKGLDSFNLSEVPYGEYAAQFQNLYKKDDTKYHAAFISQQMKTMIIYGTTTTYGGSDGLSFEDLRKRITTNSTGSIKNPITNSQIEAILATNGFSIVKNVDNVTNREFLATKAMPLPTDENLVTPANATISTVAFSLKDIATNPNVVDNGDTVTLTPKLIYREVNGVITPINKAEIDAILALPVEERAAIITNNTYLYTPFYYVLDSSENHFTARSYHLDTPTAYGKVHHGVNDTTQMSVSIDNFRVLRTTKGYRLEISTTSDDAYKALPDAHTHVQLSIIPSDGSTSRAYINGVLVGLTDKLERIFSFDINTTLNINNKDLIEFTTFKQYNDDERSLLGELVGEYDVIFSTSTSLPGTWELSDIDSMVGGFILPSNSRAITHESVMIQVGTRLTNLWSRARTVASSLGYQRHDTDVPLTYGWDIYEYNPKTDSTYFYNDDGTFTRKLLHSIGDPVLDANKRPMLKFKVGDIVLDENGNPIIQNPRLLIRNVDIFLLEGAYWFATDISSKEYINLIIENVIRWTTTELDAINKVALEQTKVYFYPRSTLGKVEVIYGAGLSKLIDAGQRFIVKLYVNSAVYRDIEMKNKLTLTTISTINDRLKRSVVSRSAIVDDLRQTYQNDVISVSVSGINGSDDLEVVTLANDKDKLSIRKKLVAGKDEVLVVSEDCVVEFINHEKSVF